MDKNELLTELRWDFDDGAWDLFNFIWVVRNCFDYLDMDFQKYYRFSVIEIIIYDRLSSDVERSWLMLRIFQFLFGGYINESIEITHDLESSDSTYSVGLEKLFTNDCVRKFGIDIENLLPRSNDIELKSMIVNIHLNLGVIIRFSKTNLYNKVTNKIWSMHKDVFCEIKDAVKRMSFTKGYVLIIPKEIVLILKNLVYIKKLVSL